MTTAAPRARPLDWPLIQIGAAAVLLFYVEVAILVQEAGEVLVLALFPLTGLVYVGTGLIAWHRRPGNRMGPLLTSGGFLWLVVALANTEVPALIAPGQVLGTVPLAFVVHLLLAFPSGRVTGRWSRVVVGAGYAVCLVLQAPLYLFTSDEAPFNVLQIAPRPDLVATTRSVQSAAGLAVMIATTVLLVRRWRFAEPRHQRVLGPLYAYGVLSVLVVPLAPRIANAVGAGPVSAVVVQLVAVALIPAAFTWCVLRGGFGRTQEVEELATWLAAPGTRPRIEEALAGALGDPTLTVAYAGGPAAQPQAVARPSPPSSPSRDVVEVTVGGGPVAWISYDAALIADREQVLAAGRVVAIELDRERLTAELLRRSREIEDSRTRMAQAEDATRRQIARDLHDGLQVQLVRLAVDAAQIGRADGAPPSVVEEAGHLHHALDLAAADLRRLVQGLMPALLIERGLFAASEELVDTAPFCVEIDLEGDDEGLSPQVESAGYFVVAEALSNAIKHSEAEHMRVALHRDATTLLIEIEDDGRGGAALTAGTGLRGLADRLDVLGGSFHVASTPGAGTRLTAQVPCAS